MRNSFASLTANGSHGSSLSHEPAPSKFVAAPLCEPPDTGAGSGGGSGSSSSSGDPSLGSGASGDAGAGAGGGSPYKLTDDSLVDFGDGKPIKWSEARSSRFMPKDQYDQGVKFLQKVAESFDAQQQSRGRGNNGHAGQGGQRGANGQFQQQPQFQQQQNGDPFAGVEDLAVVDGKTLAKIGRQMTGPIGQLVTALATRVQAMEQQFTNVSKTAGVLADNHSNTEFENFLTASLKTVPEIKGLGNIPADNEIIREIAKDVYLSHDQNDQSLRREFPKMVEERVSKLFGLFTQMQKQAVEAAKEKKRQFYNPNRGAGQPQGQGAYVHKSGNQLAAEFFGSSESGT
jgi:hypothetical protein